MTRVPLRSRPGARRPGGAGRDALRPDAHAALVVLLLYGVALGLLGPAVPSLQEAFGIGYGLAAAHLMALSAGGLLGSLSVARLRRRWSRRAVVSGGLLGMGAGVLLLAAAPAVSVGLLGAALLGLAGTAAVSVGQTALVECWRGPAGAALSVGHALAAAGLASGALLLAAGRSLGSWRLGVAAAGVLVLLVVARGTFRVLADPPGSGGPAPRTGSPAPATSQEAADRLPRAARVGVALVGLGVGLEWAVTFWLASYLRETSGLTPSAADVGTVLALLGLLAGRVAAARLARHVGAEALLAGTLALVAVGSGAYLLGPSVTVGGTAATLLGAAVLCLAVGPLFPLSATLALEAAASSPSLRERASSATLAAGGAVGIVAPLTLGLVADATTLRTALVALPLGVVVGAGLLGVLHRGRPVPGPSPSRPAAPLRDVLPPPPRS